MRLCMTGEFAQRAKTSLSLHRSANFGAKCRQTQVAPGGSEHTPIERAAAGYRSQRYIAVSVAAKSSLIDTGTVTICFISLTNSGQHLIQVISATGSPLSLGREKNARYWYEACRQKSRIIAELPVNWIAALKARLHARSDTEHEQAVLRIV